MKNAAQILFACVFAIVLGMSLSSAAPADGAYVFARDLQRQVNELQKRCNDLEICLLSGKVINCTARQAADAERHNARYGFCKNDAINRIFRWEVDNGLTRPKPISAEKTE